jgi:RES domain-containing protein
MLLIACSSITPAWSRKRHWKKDSPTSATISLPVSQALPRVLVSIQVKLQRLLDLTDQKTRRALGVSRAALLAEDWRARNQEGGEALTQTIGRLAYELNWEGLLVPSAARTGAVNLIFFPGNLLAPESYFLILNRDQLPPRLPGE